MVSYRQMLFFYLPLMIQACSQSLTYPLVAAVVVRSPLGPAALSAFAQGQIVMMVIGTLGAGLITAGMLYARDRRGYENFYWLNVYLGVIIALLQFLLAVPFGDYVFGGLLNMEGELRDAGKLTLLLCIPANFGFMLRNPYQVVLYNARASGRANAASVGRIIFTALFSGAWCRFLPDHGGIASATLVFTLPIFLEVIVSRKFAKMHLQELPETADSAAIKTQFFFAMPLSAGGFLLLLSPLIIATFIGRMPESHRMVTIHFMVMGIVNPLSYSALRIQTVLLSFVQTHGIEARKRVKNFALFTGIALGVFVATLASISVIAEWYFGIIQKLPPADVRLAAFAALCLLPYPLLQSLRSYAEGLAAWARQTRLIFCGQLMFVLTLLAVLIGLKNFAAPGYIMGVLALLAASLATQLTIQGGLYFSELRTRRGLRII